MSDNNDLIKRIADFTEREEKEVSNLVSSMSFQDLILVSKALKQGNKKEVYTILHGYGI